MPTRIDSPVSVEFIRVKVGGFNDPQVRRDDIPSIEQDDVSRDQPLRLDQARLAAAEHSGRTTSERSYGLDRSNSLDFSHEADRGIEDQDANNGAAFLPFAKVECDGGGNGEQGNHKAPKLVKKDGDQSGFLPRADRVCTVDGQPLLGLLVG